MESNIKQKIMNTARRLFSDQGFQNTSMRDIAGALNISVGNLTYHYKKKEDLIEAIILEDYKKYQKHKPLLTLADLEQFFQEAIAQKNSRPYYFQHYVQLAQICPAIYDIQVSVLQDLNQTLVDLFEKLLTNGILKREFRQEYAKIADVIMIIIAYGMPAFKQMPGGEREHFLSECIWSIMIPCLTEEGKTEYQLLVEKR